MCTIKELTTYCGFDIADWAADVMIKKAGVNSKKTSDLFRQRLEETEYIFSPYHDYSRKHYAYVVKEFYSKKIYLGGE